ncbi:peptidoglycan DD-metalloendopeptidase family protein [Candidatus Marinimicrobia bacterium]|nr:peptidoglycan DD-metalloendopeptidase family protein [Candidatus Neomarinimicrobiota bacterium]MDC3287670.1 peptidoglycan DD-metalloendopeptidase family protein [Candidatus Neomarinimicrobiota bacterium]
MNKQKSILKILFFLSITFLYSQDKDFEKSISNTEKQIRELQRAISQNNNEISILKNKAQQSSNILSITKRNIRNSQNLIKAYNKKIDLYNKQTTNLKNAIAANNSEMELIKKQYAERSINLYKKKNQEFRGLIFNSNSLNQMVYRIKYYNIISDLNQKTVDKLAQSQFYNNKKKQEIAALLKDTDKNKVLKNNELQSLDRTKRYQEKLLSDLKKEEVSIKKEIDKQINQINALETLRKTIIESKKKYDEEQLAKLKTIKTDIKKYKGKLIWPVDGKIVKGFGPQWNPKLNTTLDNPGIDIAANSTASVKSVFDGLVTTITFISGYGTTVIIDHDDGYFTVFTHLENLLINENMIVKEGQEIGFVSNNNIIHFEIWGNNQKLNPTQWIKNGYK